MISHYTSVADMAQAWLESQTFGLGGKVQRDDYQALIDGHRKLLSAPPASAKNETGIEPELMEWRDATGCYHLVRDKNQFASFLESYGEPVERYYSAAQLAEITRQRAEALAKVADR